MWLARRNGAFELAALQTEIRIEDVLIKNIAPENYKNSLKTKIFWSKER